MRSDEAWRPIYEAWLAEETDVLDFRGHPIPERLRLLLEGLGVSTGPDRPDRGDLAPTFVEIDAALTRVLEGLRLSERLTDDAIQSAVYELTIGAFESFAAELRTLIDRR